MVEATSCASADEMRKWLATSVAASLDVHERAIALLGYELFVEDEVSPVYCPEIES